MLCASCATKQHWLADVASFRVCFLLQQQAVALKCVALFCIGAATARSVACWQQNGNALRMGTRRNARRRQPQSSRSWVFRLPAFEFQSHVACNGGNFVVDFGSADRSRLTNHIAIYRDPGLLRCSCCTKRHVRSYQACRLPGDLLMQQVCLFPTKSVVLPEAYISSVDQC